MKRDGIYLGQLILAVIIGIGALVFGASTATAHHTTVTCVSPGSWSVANSQPISMTFTSPQGPSGSIGPSGSVTVNFSGDSLTIVGTWSNGFTATNSGSGNCTVPTTSSTVPETTTTTTLPCEFNPQLPPDDPGCEETTTTTSTTTTTPNPCPDPPCGPGTQVNTTTSTTTTPASTTTTTTTTPSVLSITAISPVCLRDAPYIDVTFGNQPQFNGSTATVTFVANNGQVVGTETATYQAGTTVRFVYPGAVVDAAGNPLDWPGWVFDGDEWVVDPTDAFLRDGLTVVVEVNPTASDTVSYPPATPSCDANPPTDPPPPPGGTLPQTR